MATVFDLDAARPSVTLLSREISYTNKVGNKIITKPATHVVAEGASWADIGLRERMTDEPVHLRTADDAHKSQPCEACGQIGGIFVVTASSHSFHPARCIEMED